MSRHSLAGAGNAEVVLGWDPPLATYFLQVVDRGDEAQDEDDFDPVRVWIGTSYGEVDNVDQLLALARDHAPDADTLRDQLLADRAGNRA